MNPKTSTLRYFLVTREVAWQRYLDNPTCRRGEYSFVEEAAWPSSRTRWSRRVEFRPRGPTVRRPGRHPASRAPIG